MKSCLDALLESFKTFAHRKPTDLASFFQGLPEPDTLPLPWVTWTLIGLARHRKRQHWVAEIIRTRLQGDTRTLGALGALGHPSGIPRTGTVPGMPIWEYRFHGRGCCLSHKVDGYEIDVDFYDNSADYFNLWFFETFHDSLRKPELPEQRFKELFPSFSPMGFAIEELSAGGALTSLRDDGSRPFRISDEFVAVADEIDAFCTEWENPDRRAFLAAIIGDWLAAEEAVEGQAGLVDIVSPRAENCRRQWERWLAAMLYGEYWAPSALHGLADLRSVDLDEQLERALLGPPSRKLGAALDILGQRDDASWCDRVFPLFKRINPEGEPPASYQWMEAMKFLIRHKYCLEDVLPELPRAKEENVDEAVLLALENAPQLALPLIRYGLLYGVPLYRTRVAAILALINAPWSKRELICALESSDEQEATAEIRAALLELSDPEAERIVLDWEQRNPHEDEIGSYIEIDGRQVGPFFSISEIMLKQSADYLRYDMQELHDRVMKVRYVIPPDADAPG
ncbi:hypothetical protein GC197_13580 [bacterium]|nr:hypothetical protein [bacterium]